MLLRFSEPKRVSEAVDASDSPVVRCGEGRVDSKQEEGSKSTARAFRL